jgi:ABC-type polysaccharide/polyol phosphate transport system ATPase subunit
MSTHRGELAIVAKDVGVRYDLELARRRTLRAFLSQRLGAGGAGGGHAHEEFWALRGVSFALRDGEVLGVVGRNGSGKSTLMLVIAGMLRPDSGVVRTFAHTSTLLTMGAGFESDLTGRENIYLNAAFLGFPGRKIEERLDEIIEFSELGPFIDVPLRKYSGGMRMRLGFSIAAHVEPEILLLDEVLGVGDAAFKDKSQAKLEELMEKASALVIVSHNTAFISETCTRALWLHEGRVAAYGRPDDVVARYLDSAEHQHGAVRALS